MSDTRLHFDNAPDYPAPVPPDEPATPIPREPGTQTEHSDSTSSNHSPQTELKMNMLYDRLSWHYRLNARASRYYEILNLKFIGPAILISAFSSIASFMTTASFMSTDARNYFGVCVGVLTTISTMLQSISGSCSFNTKRDSFLAAADEYAKLMTAVEFEMSMPNEEKHEFFDRIESAILDIQAKCKFIPPLELSESMPPVYANLRNSAVTAVQTAAPHNISRRPTARE